MRCAFLKTFQGFLAAAVLAAGLHGALSSSRASAETGSLSAAFDAAKAAMIAGPGPVDLAGQATLRLGPEDAFVPRPQAERLLNALGTPADPDMIGVVMARKAGGKWLISVNFHRLGFVAPEAVSRLTKEDIYDEMRRAIRRSNVRRQALGGVKIDLGEFVEPPNADPARDRLLMAARSVSYAPDDSTSEGVEAEGYVFGREGVLNFSLAIHTAGYTNLHHHLETLFDGVLFLPGKRAADVVATDVRAEYPLETLFGGRPVADVAKERSATLARMKQNEILQQEREQADWQWQLYMMAGGASLLLSSIAMFAFQRATTA